VTIRVGTSGWQYDDWREIFYPAKVPTREWLSYYAANFDTVEVNATFYRLPKQSAVEQWAVTVPSGFVMTVKASRYLTHIKRLKEPAEPVARLLDRTAPLREHHRHGPVLVQLPPAFPVAPDRLEATLAAFDRRLPIAVELRDGSWFCKPVKQILTEYGAALVWADREGRSVGPLWATADWQYLRLHHGRHGWRYDQGDLRRWARRMSEAGAGYIYTNNDPGGAAIDDARRLRDLVG
jgi:uncharacterized protein YecE (DUF72 family)